MKWFEMGYERHDAAKLIMTVGKTEEVSEGHTRTSWLTGETNTLCLLAHFENRNIYNRDTAQCELAATPFYQMQLTYNAAHDTVRAQALIEFDRHAAFIKRSGELARQHASGRNPVEIWDEAMAAMDEALYLKAQILGADVLPVMVERVPQPEWQLAS